MVIGTIQEPTRNETISVGTSSTVLSESRTNLTPRKVITIRNISPNATDTITVNFGLQQAVANAGVVLKQNESVSDSSETGYDCFNGVITAICATATGSVAIFER